MLPSMDEIKHAISQLAKKVGATSRHLPTFEHSDGTGRPHIEVDAQGLHFVVAERGTEYERKTTHDLDELLWYVFRTIAFELASGYELRHRVQSQDSRRILFEKQIELLSRISLEWAKRAMADQEKYLKSAPFDDMAHKRLRLMAELQEKGESHEEAWSIASKRYPPP